MPRLWVLNLDAEVELSGRTPSRAARERTHAWAEEVAATLPEGDAWIEHVEGDARGWEGAAWCPTPSALQQLSSRGASLPGSPGVGVLRRVNDRAFAFALHALPDARRIRDSSMLVVAQGDRVWLRRGLAFAGRGVRRVEGPATEEDLRFVEASLRRGSVFLEPQVEVLLDVSLHGHTDGRRGQLTVATLDRGQWRNSRLATDEVTVAERDCMHATVESVAAALDQAGYTGPFGIDGFRYRDAHGDVRFHPLSDLNARYSMGWPVGMGGW
ncbi:MAG: hypothetical protein AB8I08_33335 [Sandaracinaceae bacterium]